MDPRRIINALLHPAQRPGSDRLAVSAVPLLFISALLVLVAAWAMPDGYSWRSHSISESAAQGQLHGWITRLSFLCFGTAVLLISIANHGHWPRITYWCSLVFAGSMFGVAAFSHTPWQAGIEGDAFEDLLHSAFASGMGLAFVLGVAARFMQRGREELMARVLDITALTVATVLPLALASASNAGGIVQRIMFVVGYIWFGREALKYRGKFT